MKHIDCLGALALLLAACGGAATGGGATESQSALKKTAAEQVANGSATGDVCAAHGWYGDQVCDTFCQDKDTDCVPTPDKATVCAEFIEQANGLCSRKPDDPCIFQDPDCNAQTPPGAGGGDPVVCAAYIEAPDGKCSRPASDPCRGQDPDCDQSTPPSGTGGSGPVACITISESPDGVCSRPASDPCRGQDPDCVDGGGTGGNTGSGGSSSGGGGAGNSSGVACAEYIEQPDGVCSRPADDPCIFQDPDCKPAK